MDDRLHRALDDELEAHELTPRLAAELDEAQALFAGISRAIPEQPIPNLGRDVLRRIQRVETSHAASPPRKRLGVAAWLWSPQSISLRPAYAIAAALVVAVTIGIARTRRDGRHGLAVTSNAAQAELVLVNFRLEAPQARNVALAGDFSNWSPAYAMQRSAPGVWTIVVPLTPGVHEYSFVVDGKRWVPDPAAVAKPDGFGGVNSRIAVLKPDKRA